MLYYCIVSWKSLFQARNFHESIFRELVAEDWKLGDCRHHFWSQKIRTALRVNYTNEIRNFKHAYPANVEFRLVRMKFGERLKAIASNLNVGSPFPVSSATEADRLSNASWRALVLWGPALPPALWIFCRIKRSADSRPSLASLNFRRVITYFSYCACVFRQPALSMTPCTDMSNFLIVSTNLTESFESDT